MKELKISVIIPCREIDKYAEECIKGCLNLDYSNYEIIVLPDSKMKVNYRKVKIIPTGPVTPGKKRNIGIKNSTGEICAFIDSDAYPKKDWLKNAVKYFDDPEIAALGGPGITPKDDNFMQKASGFVLSSFMVGGLAKRYKPKRALESDDIHSCNFIACKSIIEKVKWNEKYWPGEDTLICLDIKKLGKKMIEASDVIIYHHRRPLLRKHLKQVSQFGLHRGFFAKKFPETSLRFTYFLPTLLILFFLVGSIASFLFPMIKKFFLLLVAVYLLLDFIVGLSTKNLRLVLPVWLGIITTHIIYGIYFLTGLFKRDLKR
jgi:cellulose synthase/poly-beta-1,6-N-acetylglucosamine synthase-like glycosyltransferase